MTHPLFICTVSDPSRGADLEGKTKVFIKTKTKGWTSPLSVKWGTVHDVDIS